MSFIGLDNLYINDEEIESIINNCNLNKQEKHRNDILFTPDSLESATSSDDDDANASTSTPSSSLICDNNDILLVDELKKENLKTTQNEAAKTEVIVEEETKKKFQPISVKNEDILEKIRKINKLQDKINDINVKIKLSNQHQNSNQNGVKTNNNYYCITNQVDDMLDSFMSNNEASSSVESNDLIDNEKFFDYADQVAEEEYFEEPNVINKNNSIEDETLEDYYFDDDTKFNENSQNYFNMNGNDNEDDDDEDILNGNFKFCLKQAQPVHKKFASTGLLFYKFKYLDTIVEVEEAGDDNPDNVITQEKMRGGNKSRKCSTSCFNLTTKLSFDDDINSCSSEILIDDNGCVSEDNLEEDVFSFNFNVNKEAHATNEENMKNESSEEEDEEEKLPEDNVERLRNIRDMFENTDTQLDEELQLQKVEKQQPSDKIKDIFLNDFDNKLKMMNEDEMTTTTTTTTATTTTNLSNDKKACIVFDSLEDLNRNETNDEDHLSTRSNTPSSVSSLSSQSAPSYTQEEEEGEERFEDGVNENESFEKKKEPVVVFTELNSVKSKFENIEANASDANNPSQAPKPVRCITPPREDVDRGEIENEPMQRQSNIIGSNEKTQDILPESGLARSRKELFQQVAENSQTGEKTRTITPPRDEKRLLKEKTPERNENVTREADRNDEVLPTAGTAKNTAAIFAGNNVSRAKSIERSGITIEGELTEKGIAKSRLALFSNLSTTQTSTTTTNGTDTENTSGIAKERLNLFKNLEQTNSRSSPPKELKKLKEFTPPPPQLQDTQQRQYIIIDKEASNQNENAEVFREAYKVDEFVPEAGLAKNRMKQYLETASSQKVQQSPHQTTNNTIANGEEQLPEKGTARSLLAKWKSIENLKDKETSPELSSNTNGNTKQTSPFNVLVNDIETTGIAKNLLNKWENLEKDGNNERSPPQTNGTNGQHNGEEIGQIEKGFAKNVLAKFQQNVAESNIIVKKSVTPPREIIARSQNVNSVYESTPAESNINSQYNNEEEVIPSPGLAKQLKSKFQTFEKDANKIETSSSKLNYVPKRFTSASIEKPKTNGKSTNGAATPSNGNVATPSTGDKCCGCDKTVYAMEKIEADKKVYHKLCFKCTTCNCTLKLGNFSSLNNKLYCTPHYIQLFARNGNYDEGFGLENYKRKWLNRPSNGNEQSAVVS